MEIIIRVAIIVTIPSTAGRTTETDPTTDLEVKATIIRTMDIMTVITAIGADLDLVVADSAAINEAGDSKLGEE